MGGGCYHCHRKGQAQGTHWRHIGDTWAEIVARNDPDAMVEMLTTLTRDYNLLGMTPLTLTD